MRPASLWKLMSQRSPHEKPFPHTAVGNLAPMLAPRRPLHGGFPLLFLWNHSHVLPGTLPPALSTRPECSQESVSVTAAMLQLSCSFHQLFHKLSYSPG